ncbi:AraC family transcriptional regulator [Acidisoma sp. L85]|uniref:helix-turn-helix transcriptional regulator n=1 Tax=Acidisoma sp. L85 TaxID=1641850 RepID=UPI00131EB27C|nr:AraC family transcriptional regulator [Acidisoma sp. L85]
MGAEGKDYFVYLSENRLCAAWGCTASSSGYTEIKPGMVYPPVRHPDDHHFDWERGRILQAYQIILVSAGRGRLQYGPAHSVMEISAGSIMLLMPGIWHRYSPDDRTGWTEHWIECRGSAFDFAAQAGLVGPDPVYRSNADIDGAFETIHHLARADANANQPVLATLGLQLLAHLAKSAESSARNNSFLIQKVTRNMHSRCSDPERPETLARELNLSYSHFRQMFKEHTGISPKRYQITIRMQRAQDLLANTNKSIKEIAAILGFNSAFHFSRQFNELYGTSPRNWRAHLHPAGS